VLAVLLLQGLVLGFSASASPGPFQALLLERAARLGPRRAMPLALVPLLSDPPVIAACLLALSGLPAGLMRLLSLAGGLFLVVLGGSALRALWRGRRGPIAAEGPPARTVDGGFWSAVAVNLLNPNAWIFWSLVGGPILAGALRESAPGPLAFLAGFYLALTSTNAATVLVFGAVGRLGPSAARALGGLSALAFLGLGLIQLGRAAR
jgi:threonine/homoserine/homoserine lactone efflux protein